MSNKDTEGKHLNIHALKRDMLIDLYNEKHIDFETLTEYQANKSTSYEKEAIEQHLEICPKCRTNLKDHRLH